MTMCSNSAPGFNASTFASAEPDALADTMPAMSHPARGTCKSPSLELAAVPTSPCTAALAEPGATVDEFRRTALEAPAVWGTDPVPIGSVAPPASASLRA